MTNELDDAQMTDKPFNLKIERIVNYLMRRLQSRAYYSITRPVPEEVRTMVHFDTSLPSVPVSVSGRGILARSLPRSKDSAFFWVLGLVLGALLRIGLRLDDMRPFS